MCVILLLISALIFIWLLAVAQWTSAERRRLVAVLALFVASALFWSVFEQAGSTLNLFAERNTNKSVLGFSFPASWLQSLGPLFIVTLAPVFAWIWFRLKTRNPSSAAKFVLGLAFAGLGFAVLLIAARRSTQGILVSPLWLTATYMLHAMGELCLSPVGLSAMTRLAPNRIVGMMLGVWFLSTSVGNYLGGRFASLYESMPLWQLFACVAATAFIAAIALAILVKPIDRLTDSKATQC
jgi:POT family proton-dependent oligopeptide transporter